MNKIFIIIGSMLISLSIDTMSELFIFKQVANRGYKININNIYSCFNNGENKLKYLLLFIPGINIINSFFKMKRLDAIKKELLLKLDNTDLFIKMSDEEYQNYLDNPKCITALNMSFFLNLNNDNIREDCKPEGYIWISNGRYRQNNDDGTYNDIMFKNENDKIIVTSVSGVISSLSDEEKLNELNKIFKCLYKKKVIIEEKSNITLEKEKLIAHRDEILASFDDENKLILK